MAYMIDLEKLKEVVESDLPEDGAVSLAGVSVLYAQVSIGIAIAERLEALAETLGYALDGEGHALHVKVES